MGAGLFIIAEVKGLDLSVDGKSVLRELTTLDLHCMKLGIATLSNFTSVSSDELRDLLGDDGDVPVRATEWFPPADGLVVVEALLKDVGAGAVKVKRRDEILADLTAYKRILEQVADRQSRWRFSMDP